MSNGHIAPPLEGGASAYPSGYVVTTVTQTVVRPLPQPSSALAALGAVVVGFVLVGIGVAAADSLLDKR